MPQSRIFAETDEATARSLMEPMEVLFEVEGLPVSAFENIDRPGSWSISVYTETEDAEETRLRLADAFKEHGVRLNLEREDIPDTDWVAATLKNLSAVRAGRFIVHGSHEAHVPKPHEIAIRIDAGLAFGTGHHGTTAGCLDMLTQVCKRKGFDNVLDLGTGSGVLAIAAAKNMPCRVLASDIDPVATITASDNARLNGVQSQVECITAAGFIHPQLKANGPFNLVIANILAKPLQSMAKDLVRYTARKGTVILSGLLPHQRAPLVATFRQQGLILEYSHYRDGWLVLVMQKP